MVPNEYSDHDLPLQVEIDEEDPNEKLRKEIARKRIFFLFFGIAVLLFAVLIFEIVELSMGGRL